MRRSFIALVLGALVLVLSVGAGGSIAANDNGKGEERGNKEHDLKSPLSEKQRALRKQGLEMKLEGKIAKDAKVARVAKGQYVELAREDEDSIWTVLGEFGDTGPLHNQIPEPDRSVDNTTIWTSDFTPGYFENLLFSEAPGAISMRNYYTEQSSNRYTVNGEVDGWVTVPRGTDYYGSNYCGSIVCARTWLFVRDSVNAWYQSQIAAGKTPAQIDDYLSQFDVWDRYDYDGDGNFDESDGYIDHFQSVHAGAGEETGGGAQGTNAIWSHRWYAFYNQIGSTGPAQNLAGGIQVGGSRYWIGDYTIEPENGGVGVFAHEFAHDLGLPDLYDTSGNTGGAENSTGFWTLMSSGSYGSSGKPEDGIGTKPTHMGNWEKFQLGWLNYEVAVAGRKSEHKLGPAEYNTKQAQGVFVVLPDKQVPLNLGAPCSTCGTKYFYSGAGDNLDSTMTKASSAGALTAKVRYDIEADWDYAYLQANVAGAWTNVQTDRSTTTNPFDQNLGFGITGVSTSADGNWVDLTASLPSGTTSVRFRYVTDGAVVEPGFQVDDIAVAGAPIGTAETDSEGWTFAGGFRITTGTETQEFFNAYVLANREYTGYDESLKTGPYNFGFLNTRPNWVEHFPYQDGLLIDYWNTQYTDNNVGDHPGGGLILPVDAYPDLTHYSDSTLMRPRILSYDSTFGREDTDRITIHRNTTEEYTIGPKPAAPVFDDRNTYWVACDSHCVNGVHPGRYQPGWNGVDVPKTGTIVRVKSQTKGGFMQVEVTSAK